MRDIFLRAVIILLLLTTFPAVKAQLSDLELSRNMIGINFFSYISRPVIDDQEEFWPVIFHGLVYRRDIGSGYFVRARFDYFQRNRDESVTDNMKVNLYSDVQMGGGWGYRFAGKVLEPYLAVDLMMMSAVKYTENGGVIAGDYRKLQTRRLGGVLMPIAGITLHATDVLSFSIETNAEMGYNHEKGTDFTWDQEGVPREEKVRNDLFFIRWNPVSLLTIELNF